MKKVFNTLIVMCFFLGMSNVYATSMCTNGASFCCETGVLKALKILAFVINAIKILVPVILLIVAFYSCGRALVAQMKDTRQILRNLIVKIIVALFVYFTPSILLGASNLFDGMETTKSNFKVCTNCLLDKNKCDDYLDNIGK